MFVTKENIRKYLLLKHLLLPPLSLNGLTGIDKVFNTLCSIQFDPQSPCGTNVDLVLQARVKNIHPQDYYSWLYQQRKGIECFDKELCIVPIEDFSLCKKIFSNNSRKNTNDFIQKNAFTIKQLFLRIKKDGEISSSQIKDNRKIDSFWGNPRWGKRCWIFFGKQGDWLFPKEKKGENIMTCPKECMVKNIFGLRKVVLFQKR